MLSKTIRMFSLPAAGGGGAGARVVVAVKVGVRTAGNVDVGVKTAGNVDVGVSGNILAGVVEGRTVGVSGNKGSLDPLSSVSMLSNSIETKSEETHT